MPKVRANGIQFHYWQSGSGPPVVMTHGLGGNLAGWHLTLVPELQSHYRVTTYDLRGHGRTDAPETGYTNRNMAEDLRGVMDALGIDRAHLVGHSWGGDISLQFALLYPDRVRSMILVEAGLLGPLAHEYRSRDWKGWTYVRNTLEDLLGAPIPQEKRFDLAFLLESMLDVPIQYGPLRGQRRDPRLVKRVMDVLMPMWRGETTDWDLTVDNLSRLDHPTLLLYESSSVFLNAFEALRGRLTNCRAVILDDGPVKDRRLKHFTLMEIPEQLLGHALPFLESEELVSRQSKA